MNDRFLPLLGLQSLHNCCYLYTSLYRRASHGSFPEGTPGNGVPKVILTVGTAFPGTQ